MSEIEDEFDIRSGAEKMVEAVAAQQAKVTDEIVRELLAQQGHDWDGTLKSLKNILYQNNMELVSTTEGDFLTGRIHTIKLVKILGQQKYTFKTKVELGG